MTENPTTIILMALAILALFAANLVIFHVIVNAAGGF